LNVIVPAAGRGTRLRPLTLDRPKPLLHVGGGTLLGHALQPLTDLPVDTWVFVVGDSGAGGDEVRRFVADRGLAAEYVTQWQPLGQSQAVSLARRWLDGPVLVFFPDMVFDADLSWPADGASGNASPEAGDAPADGVLFAQRVDEPQRFGVVTVDDARRATAIVEKPRDRGSDLAVVGAYMIRDGRRLASAIEQQMLLGRRTKGEFYLADALQIMIEEGLSFEVREARTWRDCGTLDDLLATNRFLLERLAGPETGEDLARGVTISPDSEVVSGSIGPTVRINAGCRVERSTVGHNVAVGPRCTIVDSVIGPHVSIESDCTIVGARVSDSVVGEGAVIERAEVAASALAAHVEIREVNITAILGSGSRVGSADGQSRATHQAIPAP